MNRRLSRSRRAWIAPLVTGMLLPLPIAAQQNSPEAVQTSSEHVVRKGDTLWDLAQQYLKNPFRWTAIYDANRGTVANPHRIFPAERLVIPGYGEMTITTAVVSMPSSDEVAVAVAAGGDDRTRFYPGARDDAAGGPKMLEGSDTPPVRASEFRSAPWLGEPAGIEALGRVVRVADADSDERLERYAFPFERVYVRYAEGARPVVGDRQVLVAVGRGFGKHGRVISPVAVTEVVALEEEVYTARVVEQFAPVQPGAIAIAPEPVPVLAGSEAEDVSDGPSGRVLGFSAEQLLPGIRDLAFVDLGSSAGVKVGDELVVSAAARLEGGGAAALPSEAVARLRIVRVSDGSATAKIIELTHGAIEPGTAVRVVRTLR